MVTRLTNGQLPHWRRRPPFAWVVEMDTAIVPPARVSGGQPHECARSAHRPSGSRRCGYKETSKQHPRPLLNSPTGLAGLFSRARECCFSVSCIRIYESHWDDVPNAHTSMRRWLRSLVQAFAKTGMTLRPHLAKTQEFDRLPCRLTWVNRAVRICAACAQIEQPFRPRRIRVFAS